MPGRRIGPEPGRIKPYVQMMRSRFNRQALTVIIELRYSPSCETVWARITADYPHDPNWGLGTAKIVRNSDGRTYNCDIPRGETVCFTQQVNDHHVTSYAHGIHDNGIYFRGARTAAY
ncbi:DUF2690 domain-containing protein [Thermoactinomyces vulgaris]|jgi:hypothetical protein|nr:DUF2690 domain-containing protein [Thermoactinomyces vulgaris]